nr:ABC transporter permease [Bacteroidota bacterium]
MFRNYLKTAFRNTVRQKGYAVINMLGLSIGLAATILIMLWVVNELSFNRNNENYHNIYRMVQQQMYTSGPLTTPCMPGPLAADLKKDFPEFIDVFRFYEISGVINIGDKRFADYIQMADSGLFNVFSFNFLQGSPETALQPYTAILSEKGVEKYFGDEDPMGKVIKLNDEISFRVNGVIENPPENSSFDKELFLPFHHLEDIGFTLDRYGWNTYYIYVQLPGNVDYKDVNEKIKHYMREVREDDELQVEMFLFPLGSERLYSFAGEPRQITNIYIFSIIASFILLIACINFMNLSTARASKRGREIGLRKVVGAHRRQLIYQFISESLLMAFLALIVAVILVHLLLPVFNDLTAKDLSLNILDPKILLSLVGIALITGLIAGSYPALYLAAQNPLKTIRQSTSGGISGNPWFRRSLVVFQFVLSIGLIICTIVIYRQITYINSKDLGMNKENVIYARLRGDLSENFIDFKSKLKQDPNIINVTRSSHLPFYVGSNTGGLSWQGKDNDDDVLIGFERADWDYIETMQMELADGRFFEEGYGTDTAAVVINENAVKTMGMENPVGKWIAFGDEVSDRYNIIGVVKDFNFLPLNHEIEPLSIFYSRTNYNFMMVK